MHETIEALSAYVDDEVSAGERTRIEAHLASCTDCASRKVLLERASASVRTLPPIAPTAAESLRIRRGVLGRTRRQSPFPGRLRPAWAGAGALALVAAGVVAGGSMLRHRPSHDTTTAGAGSSASQNAPVFDSPADVLSFVSTDSGVKRAYESISSSAPSGAGRTGEATTPEGPAVPPAPDAARYGTDSAKSAPAPAAPMPGSAPRELAKAASPPIGGEARSTPPGAAAERSVGDCQAERRRDQAGNVRPVLTRAATYMGKPAWLLVYAPPPPSPGAKERLVVYLVGRADCGLLSYQLVAAP
jgi:putative zinc finger protein